MRLRRFPPSGAVIPLLAGVGFATSGCLTEIERPETAIFRIEAAEEVRVITSTRFISGSSGVELVDSDTIFVTGPHEGSTPLGLPTRFYISAASLSEGNTVSLEVFIGERQWYDHTETLALDDALEFVYGFSGS